MLTNTFLHLPGIGPCDEACLWRKGIMDWKALMRYGREKLPIMIAEEAFEELERSEKELGRGNGEYFAGCLPKRETWRAFREFEGKIAYVDIETTGLSSESDELTLIGLYDGKSVRHYVKDENLEEFGKDIARFSVIATYNGARFDLPFIEAQLPKVRMGQLHIDLMFPLHSLGYWGRVESS